MNDDGSPPLGSARWMRGRELFKGYWNILKANAGCVEGVWFKMGDLLRRDEFGFYWFVGRKKDLIRRSGQTIATREVEAVIREIPKIEDVAAVPVRDVKHGEKNDVTPPDLPVERSLEPARARLAVFKMPPYIAFTPALPRITSSEKVLTRELMAVSDPLAGTYDNEETHWR
ncbi:hypothetical protein [Bradyrhizobium sp. CCBAU 11445]|uniref:hypothetical protein n=1 Tax=Bradyrhizobium sp. CCBAU 11445 TaxID=1630896 RepID=UPI002FDF3D34